MKKCIICNEIKIEEEFYKKLDKWSSRCKECEKKNQKARYIKNKEKIKKTVKLWREANKDRAKQNHKKWSIKNRLHCKIRRTEYEIKIKDKERLRKRKLRQDIYNGKKGELSRLTLRIRSLISMSIKAQNYTKKSKTHQMLGCSYEELLIHLGPKPEGNYHLDHICPCSQAQNEEELIKLQHYMNLRWLPAEENLSKSINKTIEAEEMCHKLLKRAWIY
jgi:hypothetical protein